jgi:tRNA threonylcarbamoyladenosine biosynthesis protein TsaB
MTILAFDTATSFGAVCAVAPDGRRSRAGRAGDLLAAVDELVDDPATIERIVVGRGPGSFTSIRIGLATARALSLMLDVPVKGVSTLRAYDIEHVRPVIDARRGEVFTDLWRSPRPEVLRPQDVDVAGQTVVGDGALAYREVFEQRGAHVPHDDDPIHLPDPLLMCERVGAHGFGPAELVEPLYLREPDARPQR